MDIQDKMKSTQIFDWMRTYDNYKSGVTNNQVLERFGSEYKKAWGYLKKCKTLVFFEGGKWHSWHN